MRTAGFGQRTGRYKSTMAGSLSESVLEDISVISLVVTAVARRLIWEQATRLILRECTNPARRRPVPAQAAQAAGHIRYSTTLEASSHLQERVKPGKTSIGA